MSDLETKLECEVMEYREKMNIAFTQTKAIQGRFIELEKKMKLETERANRAEEGRREAQRLLQNNTINFNEQIRSITEELMSK